MGFNVHSSHVQFYTASESVTCSVIWLDAAPEEKRSDVYADG
jgi:hypothetical protein